MCKKKLKKNKTYACTALVGANTSSSDSSLSDSVSDKCLKNFPLIIDDQKSKIHKKKFLFQKINGEKKCLHQQASIKACQHQWKKKAKPDYTH